MTDEKSSMKVNKHQLYYKFKTAIFFIQFKIELFSEVLIGPIHISSVNDQEARHKGCVPCDFLL